MSLYINESCIPSVLSDKTREWFKNQLTSAYLVWRKSNQLDYWHCHEHDRDSSDDESDDYLEIPDRIVYVTKTGTEYVVKYDNYLGPINKWVAPINYTSMTINGKKPNLVFTSLDMEKFPDEDIDCLVSGRIIKRRRSDYSSDIMFPFLNYDINPIDELNHGKKIPFSNLNFNLKSENATNKIEDLYDEWYDICLDESLEYEKNEYANFFEFFLSKCSNDEVKLRYLMTFISITEVDSGK